MMSESDLILCHEHIDFGSCGNDQHQELLNLRRTNVLLEQQLLYANASIKQIMSTVNPSRPISPYNPCDMYQIDPLDRCSYKYLYPENDYEGHVCYEPGYKHTHSPPKKRFWVRFQQVFCCLHKALLPPFRQSD